MWVIESLSERLLSVPFGSRGMSAATGQAERSEGLGFPRDCVTPVATACVSSPGTRMLTLARAEFATLELRLFKIGARVVEKATHVRISFTSLSWTPLSPACSQNALPQQAPERQGGVPPFTQARSTLNPIVLAQIPTTLRVRPRRDPSTELQLKGSPQIGRASNRGPETSGHSW